MAQRVSDNLWFVDPRNVLSVNPGAVRGDRTPSGLGAVKRGGETLGELEKGRAFDVSCATR